MSGVFCEDAVRQVQYRYTNGVVGRFGCSAMPSRPRSELLLTARSIAVPTVTPLTTCCTRPVFFSRTSMSLARRNAMLTGVVNPDAAVRTSRLGSIRVGGVGG